MLDRNMIRRDMTPDEVLWAMLPVVREAFRAPWDLMLREIGVSVFGASVSCDDGEIAAVSFASHVLPALMAWIVDPINTDPTDFDRALTAFRDAWCAAAEAQTKETT